MFLNLLFMVSALVTLACAVMVVVTKNLMHSCIYLLGSLIGIAGLYVTLGADFVAATQMMVYAGGIVVLMLFAVMLTGGKDFISKAQKLLGLIPAMGNKWSFAIGIATALTFFMSGIGIIKNVMKTSKAAPTEFNSTVEEIGKLLITDHVLAFEISSVLLLGALVGAAVIARPRKEGNK
jgi:NADH-quinone oxidoreductase subunit J